MESRSIEEGKYLSSLLYGWQTDQSGIVEPIVRGGEDRIWKNIIEDTARHEDKHKE